VKEHGSLTDSADDFRCSENAIGSEAFLYTLLLVGAVDGAIM
jgi:hypothetical protein